MPTSSAVTLLTRGTEAGSRSADPPEAPDTDEPPPAPVGLPRANAVGSRPSAAESGLPAGSLQGAVAGCAPATAGRKPAADSRQQAAGDRQRQAQEAAEARRTAARRAAREHLPSPAEVAKEIALALFEVEAGRRSAAQLERVFSPELWDMLEHQVQRHGGPLPTGSDLLRVHFQELDPGLANTVALVQRGARVQPVAMRLDACSGRWLVTELRY
ncbi:MAG TPA: Rv3235 family protein [Actinomycetes bacterium]|nr:Rv3235 family protein [Actinomycetes bacterium]